MMLAILAKGGLPQLNVPDFTPQLVWLALSFFVLYVILSRVALPRIGEVIEERSERISRDLATAERLKAETEKALAGYEQALAEARARASGIARETRETLAAESGRERVRVDGVVGAKIAEAESRIAATKTKALASVNEIAAETAGAVVTRLLGETASADEVRQALQPAAAE